MSAHNRYSITILGSRALVGTALLFRPRALLEAATDEPVDEDVALYARLLGARHLIEAALLWRWTTPTVVRAGAAIDAIHGTSAFVLITTRHHPRLATLNVASAITFSLLGMSLARKLA